MLLIGDRMSEMSSQSYSLFGIPEPGTKLVHVHPDPDELGRVYHPTLAINASATAFCAALEGLQPPNEIAWRGESDAAHADFVAWTEKATPQPGGVNLGEVMIWLRDNLPEDAIVTNGAGNFAAWIHRFYRVRQYGGLVGSTSGSMGYGFPAALGMQTLYPQRTVVCVAGDGDFLMTGQDFATAVQYGLPIIVVISDNGLYGTIRMHQERDFPGRVVATELRNPDFAGYATGVRRLRRQGREDRGFPRRLRRGQGLRQAGDRPPQDRSGGADARRHLVGDPREVAGGWPSALTLVRRVGTTRLWSFRGVAPSP